MDPLTHPAIEDTSAESGTNNFWAYTDGITLFPLDMIYPTFSELTTNVPILITDPSCIDLKYGIPND